MSARLNLSSQAKTRSIVLNRSLKIARSNNLAGPGLAFFRFLLFSGIFGFMPLLKIIFRFFLLSYAPSRLIVEPAILLPIDFMTRFSSLNDLGNSGDSCLLPGARCCNKRSNNITISVADRHNFFSFKMLMSTVTKVVTAFLGCGSRTISMKYG